MGQARIVLNAAALLVSVAVLGFGCSVERTLKAAGQECRATTECEDGLLCDFAAEPPVCAGEGSGPQPVDDDAGEIDASPVDAPTPDAPAPDADVDAAI